MSPPVPAYTGAGGRLSAGTLILHWSVGLGVLGMLAYGFWLQTLPTGPSKAPWVQTHKSFGILIFALALVRIVWRWREGFPPSAGRHPIWERRAAIGLHVFMITATVLMPVSGILRSLAYGRPITVFGLPLIPRVFEAKQELLYALSSNLHDGLAFALAGAIALHVAAAILHQIRGDATLVRMLGGRGTSATPGDL